MLTLRETRLENHHAAALALGRVVPDAAAANKPRASLRMGASLARFRRCLLFGSAKSRGTVRLIKTSFANYSPMLEWDFVKSGASPVFVEMSSSLLTGGLTTID
jgi:hypothetical protein